MVRRTKIPTVPKGRPKPLYPQGWPRNLRAALYLNSKAREARQQGEE